MSKSFFSFVITCALLLPLRGVQRFDAALVGNSPIIPVFANYESIPLHFELNQGQTHQRVKFLARSEGYILFLTATEVVMALDNPATHRKGKENRDRTEDSASSQQRGRPLRSIVRMKLEGANHAAQIEGLEQLTT